VGRDAATDEFRQRVDRTVLVLFATVIDTTNWATTALLDQDLGRADQIIAADRRVDDRVEELTSLIKERLAHHSVDSEELEDLVTILQMAPELERSADLAEHIAQRTRQGLGGNISPRSRGLIQLMCDACLGMWQLANQAYAEHSRDISLEIQEADDELDSLAGSLLVEGASEGADPAVAAELALVARFYERLGDHAVNLGKRMSELNAPRHLSPARAASTQSPSTFGGESRMASRRLRAILGRLLRLPLVSADAGFFELFKSATSNVVDGAEALRKMLAGFDSLDHQYEEIRAFEHKGSQITADLLRRLDHSFVTPYDRGDIHLLTEEIDDVVDDIFSAAELVHLVPVKQQLPEAPETTEILTNMASELDSLIGCLKSREGARRRLERIETLEREGDALFRRGIARLFSGDYEPLEVLKWKDILQSIKNAANRIEDVSDVVESIMVKGRLFA
jgi:predicted phosphate transport protein (TIGR00153 family)